MIASTQTTNTEMFGFIALLVFKLLSRKVLLINRKDNTPSLNIFAVTTCHMKTRSYLVNCKQTDIHM